MAQKAVGTCLGTGLKHDFKVKGTEEFKSKTWTRLDCATCDHYLFVEHGWFQTPRPEWAKTEGASNA